MSSKLSSWLSDGSISQLVKSPIAQSCGLVVISVLGVLAAQASVRHYKRDGLTFEIEQSLKRPRSLRNGSALSESSTRRPPVESSFSYEETRDESVFDESIIREFLARNYAFLDQEGCQRVRQAFCIVVGLGGVGSAAAAMLVRSGVRKVRLIDFDQLNKKRHAIATLADVGTPKAEACRNAFAKIAPWVEVDARVEMWSWEDAAHLLDGKPDFVLDCIDNITTKVQLLKYCKQNNINVFSAMGAASKCDPTRIQISDISYTFEDPLARAVRRRLKIEGITNGIPVYSTEKPNEDAALLPLPEDEFQKGAVGELSALEAFRVRILPCLGPLPGMFGQAAAAYIVASLGGARIKPMPIKQRLKTYNKALRALMVLERRLNGQDHTIPLSEEDMEYLIEDLHCGRSVVAPTYVYPQHPTPCRWDKDAPLTVANCVLFERTEANKHFTEVLQGNRTAEEVWGPETCELVRQRADEDVKLRRWRF